MKENNPMNIIDIECSACQGTGLYHGFAEPPGVGVICVKCVGTGKVEFRYTPFTKRKTRTDIRTVQHSRGSFIGTGVGPVGPSLTYQEFLNS